RQRLRGRHDVHHRRRARDRHQRERGRRHRAHSTQPAGAAPDRAHDAGRLLRHLDLHVPLRGTHVSTTLLRSTMTACLALAGTAAAQSTLALDSQTSILRTIGSTVAVSVTGPVGSPVALMLDTSPGPTSFPALGITVPVGVTPAFVINVVGTVPASGTLTYD